MRNWKEQGAWVLYLHSLIRTWMFYLEQVQCNIFIERYQQNYIPIALPGGNDLWFLKKFKNPDLMKEFMQSGGNLEWYDGFPVLDDLYDYNDEWKIPDNVKPMIKNYRLTKFKNILMP